MKQYFLQIKKALSNKNRGASLTGYGLMVGLIAVVAIVAIGNIGSNVSLLFSRTSNVLEAASSGTNFAASTPTAASLSIAVTTGDKDNMDITGPTNPAFGTMVSFTIQNIGETTTGVLSGGTLSTDTSSTGDTDNFEFDTSGGVGNSCAGITLAPNASCNLDIRPFASNSGSYTGTLSISDINLNENISLSGTASGLAVPGYFVLGGNVTGNIGAGGLGGADATCEVTLRDTDWLGKDDVAGCTSSSCPIAHAFLCDSLTCNNLQPNATYKFANATGSGSTNGGAEFTTDASGRGPNDAKNWSDNDAFGTSAVWWANRFVSNSSFWETTPSATNPNSVCSDWTTSVNFRTGLYGDVNNVDGQRWNESLVSCNNARRLICYINP